VITLKPPRITSIQTNETLYASDISIRLDADGIVYLAVFPVATFPTMDSLLKSSKDIKERAVKVVRSKLRTARIALDNLLPATEYFIYTVTESPFGELLPFEAVSANRIKIRTLCCRAIRWSNPVNQVITGRDTLDYLSFTLLSSPIKLFVVPMILMASESNGSSSSFLLENQMDVSSNLVPRNLEIPLSQQNAGTLVTIKISLNRLTQSGLFELNITLPIELQSMYSFVTATTTLVNGGSGIFKETGTFSTVKGINAKLLVISEFTPLPAPKFHKAIFSNDGSYVEISLDSNSDHGGASSSFTCSALFGFACAELSRCVWIDDKTVRAYVYNKDYCASPGSMIVLASAAKIRAACSGSSIEALKSCSTWSVMEISSLTILPPVLADSPRVILNVPAAISSCGSILVDVTMSTGHGGRSWSNGSLALSIVDSTDQAVGNMTQIVLEIQSKFSVSPPMKIDSSYLLADSSYVFKVTLCNFLGQCSIMTKSTWISSSAVLSVMIAGLSSRSMTPSQSLSLSALGSITQCGGLNTLPQIKYQWTIYEAGKVSALTSLVSTSKDPSKFNLAGYSLTKNMVYKIEVTASSGSQQSSASVEVTVGSGALQLLMEGGNNVARSMRPGATFVLDAQKSYDEDVKSLVGRVAGLQYSWACVQVEPVLNSTCGSVLSDVSMFGLSGEEKIVLSSKADDSLAGSKLMVTLFMSSAGDTRRSVSSTIPVSILPSLAASLALTSNMPADAGKLNVDKQVQITAKVVVPGGLSGDLEWMLEDGDAVDFSSVALTTYKKSIVSSADYQTLSMNLVLGKNSLTGGVAYKFRLASSLKEPGVSTSAVISIAMNAAPQPGEFSVTPREGQELSEEFLFSGSNWQDVDLPLSYQFGYWSPSQTLLVVRSKLELATASLTLPAGSSGGNYSVLCSMEVFDSLSAKSLSQDHIVVTPVPIMSSEQLKSFLSDSLTFFAEATDADSIKQSVLVGSYLLNRADCSLATDCSKLRRQSCYATNNTCGACYSGYIGDAGDANTLCLSIEEAQAVLQQSMASNSTAQKACLNDCSGRGYCQYFSQTSGREVDSCGLNAMDCYADCVCDVGYGGKVCQYTSEELEERFEYRKQLIEGAIRVADLDSSTESVDAVVNSMNEVGLRSDEVSVDAADMIIGFVSTVLTPSSSSSDESSVQTNALSTFTMEKLLNTVDIVATVFASDSALRRRYRRLSVTNSSTKAEKGVDLMKLLQTFSSTYASSMIAGQQPAEFVRNNFKMQIADYEVEELRTIGSSSRCNVTKTVSLPQSIKEKLMNYPANTMIIPLCRANMSSAVIAASSMSSTIFIDQAFESDPASLQLSSFPCDEVASCTVGLTLYRNNKQDMQNASSSLSSEEQTLLTFECGKGEVGSKEAICPDGQHVSVDCIGEQQTITGYCPATKIEPSCSTLSGLTMGGGCKSIASDEDTVTCECSLLSPLSGFGLDADDKRKLIMSASKNGTTVPNGEISINYVSMLEVVSETFIATVVTATNLDASSIRKSWQSLLVVGLLALAIVCLMGIGHYMDKLVINEMESLKKVSSPAAFQLSRQSRLSSNFKSLRQPRISMFSSINGVVRTSLKSAPSSFLQIAEEALPQVLNSRSFMSKYKHELKRHHRWAGVFFHFTKKFPRALRVLALATNIITMLFIQSITYNLTNGDDGSCERLHDEVSCLEPNSAFSGGSSKCFWISEGGSNGHCKFVQPESNMNVIIFVAIFSAVISTPIAFSIDWIIQHVLSAPTISSKKKQIVAIAPFQNTSIPQTLAVIPSLTDKAGCSQIVTSKTRRKADLTLMSITKTEDKLQRTAQKDFEKLIHHLQAYRMTLADKGEFDGKFHQTTSFTFC
jgi:hypothetical protein